MSKYDARAEAIAFIDRHDLDERLEFRRNLMMALRADLNGVLTRAYDAGRASATPVETGAAEGLPGGPMPGVGQGAQAAVGGGAGADEEKRVRLDERAKVFGEIQTALSCVSGFRPAALKVEEWKGISDGFPENARPALPAVVEGEPAK